MEIIQIVGSFVAIIVCLAIPAVWAVQRKISQLEQSSEQKIQRLQQQIELVNRGAVGVGRRLINVEKSLHITAEKQSDLSQSDDGYLPYSQAMTLLDQGADKHQLVIQCGLSEAEAHLMELIHNPTQTTPTRFK